MRNWLYGFISMNNLLNKIHQTDCTEFIKQLPDESIDVILTDPPYLYLKNQKLDRPFDEQTFFTEAKRVLKKNGFIVLFGRGTSFYRWNTILDDLGFNFKEEVIWNKMLISSPVTPIMRKHETISIYAKEKGKINKSKVDFFEKNLHNPEKIIEVVKRIKSTFGNRKTFELLEKYFKDGYKDYAPTPHKHCLTRSSNSSKHINRTIQFVATMEEGVTEQSIIDVVPEHYNYIHPTQKPPRLLERLLALVSQEGDIIFDPFSGSGSTAIACINSNRKFIGCEIDEEYWSKGDERVQKHLNEKQKEVVQTELFNEAI